MNFTKGIVKSLLGLALVVTIGGAAFAAHEGKNHNPLQRLQSKLNLSPDQVAKLQPTFESMKQRHEAQRAQFESRMASVLTPEQMSQWQKNKGEHHRGMKELNLTPEQKAKLKAMRGENAPQRKAQRAQIESQIMAVLTPDQQAKFKEMKEHQGHHKHHRDH